MRDPIGTPRAAVAVAGLEKKIFSPIRRETQGLIKVSVEEALE